jgi:hypothetical protein
LLPQLRYALEHKEALTLPEIGKRVTEANDTIRKVRQILLELS